MSNNPSDAPINANPTPLNQGTGQDGISRVSPLITPQILKRKYLLGVPMKAALTGEVIEVEDLQDYINDAIGEVEMTVRIPVSPTEQVDKFDFFRSDDLQFSTRRLTRWPVIQVKKLSALWPGRSESDDQEQVYPTSWVSIQADSGVMQILPNSSSLTQADAQFLSSMPYRALTLGNMHAWPNMWRVTYTCGFDNDKVPHSVNKLIGLIAAKDFLGQMGPAIFPMNSVSVGIDGMSQGSGSPGPAWLAERIQELSADIDALTLKLKSFYGTDIYLGVW